MPNKWPLGFPEAMAVDESGWVTLVPHRVTRPLGHRAEALRALSHRGGEFPGRRTGARVRRRLTLVQGFAGPELPAHLLAERTGKHDHPILVALAAAHHDLAAARVEVVDADGIDVAEVDLQHVAVEEQDGGQGLVPGAGGDATVDDEMGEEGLDLRHAHFLRVAPPAGGAVEAYELLVQER